MSKFRAREIAEYLSEQDDKGVAGDGWVDCEIKSASFDDGRGEAYWIRVSGDIRDYKCEVEHLRKKKPPEETSSWEEMQKLTQWNPTKVTA